MQDKLKLGVHKLCSGKYQASVTYPNGERVRNKFSTRKAASAYLKGLGSAKTTAGSDQLMIQLIERFLQKYPDSRMRSRSPKVFESFVNRFGGMSASAITKIQLSDWIGQTKTATGYASRTMLQVKYSFTPFFNELVETNVITRNPLTDVKIRMGTRAKERVFLSETELASIVQGLRRVSPTLTYPVIYFLLHTGCKINEALSLIWAQLDFKGETVSFRSAPNSDERTIQLSPQLKDFLKVHPTTSDFVFTDENKQPWTKSRYGKRFSRDRAHVAFSKRWDNVTIRHSFAYHFLRKGRTLSQLQVILGHRNISDTIAAYGTITSQTDEKLSPYA